MVPFNVIFPCLLPALVIMSCMNSLSTEASTNFSSSEMDKQALLQFKIAIMKDPLGALTSWSNNTSIHFCDWKGVVCDRLQQRVNIIDLSSLQLTGSLSPCIANLTALRELYLVDNNLQGPLPHEVGFLSHLQQLDLKANHFTGEIPTSLSNCRDLQFIRLRYNEFVGNIPTKLTTLPKLQTLDLFANNLTGSIPPSIGNVSTLLHLSLALNGLEGSIPSELGQIPGLQTINLYGNYLSGTIPLSLLNLSSLTHLLLAQNNLHGSIPSNIGVALPNLYQFAGGLNNFTGSIPASLSNASGLTVLDFADSCIGGSMPTSLGVLQKLVRLNFGSNVLETDRSVGMGFISSLTNCTSLEVLGLDSNLFSGTLPGSITNLSLHLTFLGLGSNQLSGKFPVGIERYANLSFLSMENNFFTGSIPPVIAKLPVLQYLYLSGNEFFGQIPSSLGNLSQLTSLRLERNGFIGTIPPDLGSCQHLQTLNLAGNKLSGTIPPSIMSILSLSLSLNLSQNYLTGPLPSEVGNLKSLGILALSGNKLSGEIPATLSNCLGLESLSLEGNLLQGAIPLSLSSLLGIQEIDLSRNNLSGPIPQFLTKLSSLKFLNLSFNDFDGELPVKGVFGNASAFSVLGNTKLCGGIESLGISQCPLKFIENQEKRALIMKITIPISTFGLVFLLLACYVLIRRSRKSIKSKRLDISTTLSIQIGPLQVSYAELLSSTNRFSSANLIGIGTFGSVYKGENVCDEQIVAVKVLNTQQDTSGSQIFEYECESLRNVRHRNLIKIITSCSTVDFRGKEFKAMVYEYMPNENLETWLHPVQALEDQSYLRSLKFIDRLNIAIDVAAALDYLHNHCYTPIVHCNLKPSNVLLDNDMNAHVGDFGLSRVLPEVMGEISHDQIISSRIKGSAGYLAPEYGTGAPASASGDVYSYGILVLEMFTGRKPTDDMFINGDSLHHFAKRAFPERVIEIIDPMMQLEEAIDEGKGEGQDSSHLPGMGVLECLVSVIEIGISCSKTVARERMEMRGVSVEMGRIRSTFLRLGVHGQTKKMDKQESLSLK